MSHPWRQKLCIGVLGVPGTCLPPSNLFSHKSVYPVIRLGLVGSFSMGLPLFHLFSSRMSRGLTGDEVELATTSLSLKLMCNNKTNDFDSSDPKVITESTGWSAT